MIEEKLLRLFIKKEDVNLKLNGNFENEFCLFKVEKGCLVLKI